MKNIILRNIESSRDYAVELQRGLTAIPAISPLSGGEGEIDKALWLQGELKKLKFDSISRYDAPDPKAKKGIRPNIVARYKGQDSSRTLWIMSHLDIVPPGERKLWKTDPYKLHISGGKLYGRGVEDNQQASVAGMVVAKAFMDAGVRPPIDLALLFVADEEVGSGFGADWLTRKHRSLFGRRDMFLVPDGGNKEGSLVEVAEKSIWWQKVTTHGAQCHASMPSAGRNAFRAASELVTMMNGLYKTFAKRDNLYRPPYSTFEPTKKEANVPNVNTIPGEDVFYLDSRVLPSYKLSAVAKELRRLANQVERKHKVKIVFEDLQKGEAAPPTDPNAEIVKRLIASIKEIHGTHPKPQGIGGGTVAAFLRRLDLPAVVYSKIDESAHQPNEHCTMDFLIGDAKVFGLTLLRSAS
ncbi:MAG: M20 family metallo-hydrolase [Elusimicrobia bacterium]|nr:M20 family metallo-hydrolase [Elusimicrobiota bacterium]